MAGWNDETLAYSSRHAHETHERWGKLPHSAAWTALNDYWRRACELADQTPELDRTEAVARACGALRAQGVLEPDEIHDQCGGCAFYVSLDGALGADWGVCTNVASPHDGQVMFEHDGCAAHEHSPPLTLEDLTSYRDALRTGLDRGFQAGVRKQDRAELRRVEKLLDTAAQSATSLPPTSPPE
jgi:hypothetical protein